MPPSPSAPTPPAKSPAQVEYEALLASGLAPCDIDMTTDGTGQVVAVRVVGGRKPVVSGPYTSANV